MHCPDLRPQTRVSSGLRLKLTNAMPVETQVALTGMRVVTQDFGRKSKLKFFVVTQVGSYVKPVVTRGSTVHYNEILTEQLILRHLFQCYFIQFCYY
jgi:hypothetical protein